MPKISMKGQAMPPSPIRKLVPFAEKAIKEGKKIFHLNIGQPDIKTPRIMLEKLNEIHIDVLEYTHSAGIESYRRKLVGYYNQFNIKLDYTDIMITTGGSEAILFAMMSCLDPGDEIIIPEPFYANYNGFATTSGISIKPVTSYIENGFALPSMEEFEKRITPKTKAIIICNPNNPTGYLYSRKELETLGEICRKHDLYLFADEVYREFCYDGKEHFSVLNLDGLDQNVIVVDSISKRYSACGARIGAMITRNKEVFNTALKFAQARLSPPTLGQIAGEAALDVPQSYFDDVKAEYVARRDFVVEALNKMPGVICPNPGGAFYTIAKLPVKDSDAFCQWLLESFSYEGKTVMLAPASGFYATPGFGKNEVRIAYVLKLDDLKMAMKCLEKALEVYPEKVAVREVSVTN